MIDDAAVLHELAPVAAKLVDRHLANAKEWFPHEYVPWSLGRDFEPDEQWSADAGADAGGRAVGAAW